MVDSGALSAVADAACGTSQIDGSVLVENGKGDVSLGGAALLQGDLSVVEHRGNVVVDGGLLSDVSISIISGRRSPESCWQIRCIKTSVSVSRAR